MNFKSTKHIPFYEGERQQVYKFPNGHGVSLVPMFIDPTKVEAAHLTFDREPFHVHDVSRGLDEGAIEAYLDKIKELPST